MVRLHANGSRRQTDTVQLKKSKDHVVEIRKFQKNYLQFIKASQRYYRQHILNLDAHFDGIPELRKIAHKWKDDGMSTVIAGVAATHTTQLPRRPRARAYPRPSETPSSSPATRH